MKPRHLLLAAALAATLVAVWLAGDEDAASTALVEPAPRRDAPLAAAAPTNATDIAGAAATPARFVLGGKDLFPAQSWVPPPPPPPPMPQALPPPPPQAPPLPYRYLGRWLDDGVETVFLARGDLLLSARGGDHLGDWRLDEVRDERLTFTYLPLQQLRQLGISP